jgi:hypothetical protein
VSRVVIEVVAEKGLLVVVMVVMVMAVEMPAGSRGGVTHFLR